VSWTIKPLNLGVLRNRPKDSITNGRGKGELVDLPCISWLLRNENKVILVDAGPSTSEHALTYHKVELEKTVDHDLVRLLRKEGLSPSDIEIVVLTHLHWDHSYGLTELPYSKIFVQDSELRYGVYPSEPDYRVYEFKKESHFASYINRMQLVTGDCEIADGITLIATPGHSPGHQCVLVKGKNQSYLIGGDFIDLYENWDERIPSGPTVHFEEWEKSYEKVMKLNVRILPGHDMRVFENLVYK
jgi:glyoxylase-like metal-dependent hydrolase (beta-lactamase superfamily II)